MKAVTPGATKNCSTRSRWKHKRILQEKEKPGWERGTAWPAPRGDRERGGDAAPLPVSLLSPRGTSVPKTPGLPLLTSGPGATCPLCPGSAVSWALLPASVAEFVPSLTGGPELPRGFGVRTLRGAVFVFFLLLVKEMSG